MAWQAQLVLKDEGTFAPQPARNFKDFFIQLLLPQYTHTQLLLRYHKPWRRSKLPDSCYNCLLQTQSGQLSKRFFIYLQLMFCAQQKWCRNYHVRFCEVHYARGRMRLQHSHFPTACISFRRCQFEEKRKFEMKIYQNWYTVKNFLGPGLKFMFPRTATA